MTTNKPNVQRYDNMGCPEQICRVDTMHESDDGDYVLYEDYEALQAECEKLRDAMIEAKGHISHYMHGGSSYREPAAKAVALIDAALSKQGKERIQ